jgi:hypothetical protein
LRVATTEAVCAGTTLAILCCATRKGLAIDSVAWEYCDTIGKQKRRLTRAARLVLRALAAGAASSGGSRKSGSRKGRQGQERSHETDHCVRLCTGS